MTSLKERTITAFLWRLLERGGNQCVALIVQIVMARLLTPNDFGLLAILLVLINIGNIIVLSGLGNSLVQSQHVKSLDFSTVFWLMMVIAILMYLLVFSMAPAISEIYEAPILTEALRALGFVFILGAIESVQTAYVQRDLKFRILFKATVASTLISGGAGITLAFTGAGLWSLVAQQIVYHLANCIALAAQTRWSPSLSFSRKIARTHFAFGWRIMVPSLLETLYSSLSNLLIGKQFGSNALGFVSQGEKYPVAIDSMISGTLQPVLLAAISRAQNDISAVKSIVKRTLQISFFFIAPIMTCFALTASPIISLLLGDQWLPAVPFLQMYCISSALSSFHAINYESFNGMGRSDLFLKTKLVTVSYGIVLMLISIFVIRDVNIVVAAYAFSSFLSTAVNAFPNHKLIKYPYAEQIRDILPSIFCAAISSLAILPISSFNVYPVAHLALQWLIFLLAYVLLSFAFNKKQISFLSQEIKKKIRKTPTFSK